MADSKFMMRMKGALAGFRSPLASGLAPTQNGWIPIHWDWNFWQEGKNPIQMECNAAVEAGVSAYAQTIAMLPGMVWRKNDDGGRTALPESPLAKILFRPNSYQTRSDFLMNQVRALLFRGNCYALAVDNERGDIVELHPVHPQNVQPYVDPVTKDVFYSIAPTDLTPDADGWPFDPARTVPARYVWHVRMATPHHPLVGVTPLTSAALSIQANCSIQGQQSQFFANMSRPSGVLQTEMTLTAAQVAELRSRWEEHSKGIALGGVPILTAGLKWEPLTMTAADAQLIEYYRLSIADIARALRVPLPLVGVMDQATYSNTETLMQFWKASGLGWMLEHIELSLDQFFGLPSDQYCELDTDALLRSQFKDRIDALVRGVQGGVYAPNEARRLEGLPAVEDGDQPRVQQQLVPLDFGTQEPPAAAPPPPAATPDEGGGDVPPTPGERSALAALRRDLAALDGRQQAQQEARTADALMVIESVRRLDALQDALHARLLTLRDGVDGAPGADGRDGVDGAPGADGRDGSPGETPDVAPLVQAAREELHADMLQAVTEAVSAAVEAAMGPHREYLASLEAMALARIESVRDGVDGAPGEPGPAGAPGRLLENWRGDWDVTAIYQQNEIARVPDGSVWVALGLTHDAPTADSDTWQMLIPPPARGPGFNFRGEFRPGMEVEPGDTVRGEAGASWVWMGAPSISHALPGPGWALMVKQGANGRTGKQGEPGPMGAGIEAITPGLDCLIFTMTDGRVLTVDLGGRDG